MKPYDHSKIEKKWQKFWDENKVYKTLDAKRATAKGIKPYYVLDMFPYPSGSGLHVGHPRGYIASDVFARMKRMQGFNVLHPMGFDSFGLPAEQYAIQTGKNPGTFTEQLVKRYKTQLSILGLSYDWDRQVATHDPKYYKWTQWIFLQIYNSWYDTKKKSARPIAELEKIFETKGNKSVTAWTQYSSVFSAKEWNAKSEVEQQEILMNYRLAYEGYAEVNWCPELGTVLANDEVVEKNGRMVSERGEFAVEKKNMRQWFMRITAYGDRLLEGLETIDWSNSIKEIQKNWIGKSEGAEIEFEITTDKEKYLIFDFDGVLGDTWEQTVSINMELANIDRDNSIRKTKEYFSRKPIHARGAHADVVNAQTEWALKFDKKMAAAQFDLFEEFIKEITKIKNTKIAIVSSGTNGYIKPAIKRINQLGIHPTHVLTYEDHHSKEEKIEHICKDWNIEVCNAYYFTDTKYDVYELETICDKSKLIGCGWGFLGAESLCEVLPRNQVLVNYDDVHNIFKSALSPKATVFTTRPDTLFGVTYLVLAPEHAMVQELKSSIKNWKEVEQYIADTKRKDDITRTANEKDKTGVKLEGVFAINPINGEQVPMWIADYVLANYGTGAVMAVPAHDERDFVFAKKYELPIKQVIEPVFEQKTGDSTLQEGLEIQYRDVMSIAVRDPKTNKYLTISWKGMDMKGFVTGGTEGEDIEFAARREILEESGYKNLKLISISPINIHTKFYQRQKKVNRHARWNFVLFDLIDHDRDEVPAEEQKLHEIVWIDEVKLMTYFSFPESIYFAHILNDKFEFLTNEGILANSGSFNGLYSSEAKKKITEFVNGKWVTKYKFRDAIFARQRYWGEPIPLVHENAPLKVFFLKSSLQKGYDKELSKLSISKSLHEDWGINYFVDEKNLTKFIATAQKLLLDKKDDIWYFDVSGSQQLVCYKKKIFNVTDPVQNELAKQHGRLGGIPEEQLDWKVQDSLDSRIIKEISEKQLPLELPKVKSYAPAGDGQSPLATVKSWVKAGYETNTMPGWAGSSWYFLRYTDPTNSKKFADSRELDYWFGKNGGVNMYVGGAEHSTGHLLYSRFWHKVLHDLGHVKTDEPFMKLRNQGMIGGADGRKMSKRWGNVVNPDDVVKQFGADTMRVYEAFVGPFESDLPWSTDGIVGSRRFVERIWRFQEKVSDTAKTPIELQKSLHKTIKKVTDDITTFSFNTAVSAMMIFANELEKHKSINVKDFKKFLQILAPFAPYMTDELWNSLGEKGTVHHASWPKFDPKLIVDDTVTIGIQVNGKVRAEITIAKHINQSELEKQVYAMEDVQKWIATKDVKKFIYVPGKIINIVI